MLTKVRPLAVEDVPGLLGFARAYFGPNSHQADAQRFEWLFRHNPLSQGPNKDVVVAVAEDGRIVGCHWKMRLGWRWEGQAITIPSLHDLALLPQFRKGQGVSLVLAALSGEKYAALLGLSAISDGIYKRMHCPRVPMVWLQKVLSYARTTLGMARMTRIEAPPKRHWEWKFGDKAVVLYSDPPAESIERALRLPYAGSCHLEWTSETYCWRFFHTAGPKNLLLLMGDPQQPSGRAVFSYGQRRGAAMARLVDAAVSEPGLYPTLLDCTELAMRRLGIAVATAAFTSELARNHLLATGWRLKTGVSARFYLRGPSTLQGTDIWGGSYDYGFDAI